MKFNILLCSLCVSLSTYSQQGVDGANKQEASERFGQETGDVVKKLQGLKVSGYIQGQYQYGEEDASLKVGTASAENEGEPFSRIGIRRGRVKLVYEEKSLSAVFQTDLTEKGLKLRDAYLNIKDPWWGSSALRVGVYPVPFGYEAPRSSSRRESPERSAVIETLLPDMRDVGVMLQLRAEESSPLRFLKLEAGLFAGNSIQPENDSKRNLITHLSANKVFDFMEAGAGVSYYNGFLYQGSENVYRMQGNSFVLYTDPANEGKFAKREYLGVDGQVAVSSVLGRTSLSAEYLFGEQPGSASSDKSPHTSELPSFDTYIREFRGGYLMLVQGIGRYPFSAVAKYDWYDPNTRVKDDELGLGNTGSTDIAVNTLGFGMLWDASKSFRLQAYYEIKRNERTEHLPDYASDRKDNVFTVRLQYVF